MDKLLHCECGFEVRDDDEGQFVARVQRHARDVHGMQLSAEEVLQLAFRAELDEAVWQQRLGDQTTGDEP